MFRRFIHFSPLITACALTAFLSAGFITDETVQSKQNYGRTNCWPIISLLQPGVAAAQAEWETLKFTNAAEDLWAGETYIIGRDVNMRSGPDIASESQGFFRFGEPVKIKEDLGDWYKVECRYNVVPHYVYKKYVGSWSDVKAKFIPGSDCMMQIDKLYDCLNMAAPFNIKGLDRERKLKEIDHYLDVIDKTYNYIESSKLPPEAVRDMCQAVDMIEDMFKCQRRFVTEPEQAANMRDEAYPDLQEYFQKHYETLEKYR
jgi:hypothetical protein